MDYSIVVETGPDGCAAYAPDLPNCIAVGATVEETIALMREAVEFHIEGMRLAGEPVPRPTSILPSVTVVNCAQPS